MSFSYLSVCSGLEGASLAFEPLGARAVGFAEIEAFPSAIIAHRYGSNLPGEPLSHNAPPNFGDFTRIPLETLGQVDVLIGGTPCQAFSIAGKRLSLEDARGNLTLAYAVLAHELARSHGLRNAVWENVPGALNTADNAFGCFLGAIVGADDALHTPDGGSWPDAGMVAGPRARAAWRVLDAQYFGLAQRRRRVFLVADFGNGADPAAVLFERAGLRGDSPPRREAREGIAPTIAARTRGGGGLGTDFDCDGGLIAKPLLSGGHANNPLDETLVAHALRGEWFDASEDGTGRGTRIVPICFDETQITHPANRSNPQPGEPSHALAKGARPPMIAFSCKDHGADATDDLAPTMRAMPHSDSHPNAGGQLAVAFDLRGRLGGSQFEGPHDTANIRAASGGSSRSYVLAPDDTLLHNGVRQKGDANGREIEGNAAQVLRAMREEIGAEAFTQWGLGILDSLQPEEVLRPLVHGRELRLPGSEAGPELDDGASSRAEACSAGLMREMWEAGCERRSPQGWEPSEQRAREFAAALSLLSHEGAQSEAIMLAMWEASEGLRILREALSALQKIRRPAVNEDQSAHSRWEVRRLTPVECERLMGVPDDYTRIPWRGKPAEQCPDGPRYKALGNSWAVPVVRWIGERLAAQLEAR